MHEWQNKEADKAFNHILDTFGGANTDFASFMFMMREMDKRAAKGDKAAGEIVLSMIRFSRLIKAANQQSK